MAVFLPRPVVRVLPMPKRPASASLERKVVRWCALAVRFVAIAGIACLLCGAGVFDKAQVFDFDVPSQNARDALAAVAQQTHTQLLFPYDLVKSQTTNRLQGRYTLSHALDVLLSGTGLSGSVTESGVITISFSPEGKHDTRSEPHGPQGLANRAGKEAASGASDFAGSRSKALEEVIVTAERRAEDIQHLPIAVSAFSDRDLADRGVSGLDSLQRMASSLQFGLKEASFAKISMRGVGTDLLGLDVEPAVAIIQDGVPYASQWVNVADFLDTERVEVLRGPQGTISGRNATGGAIHIHSKLPSTAPEAGLKATLGNRERFAVEGVLSGPLHADRWLGRIAVRSDRAEGWVRNTLLDQGLGNTEVLQGRASLVANLADGLQGHLILETVRDRSRAFFVEDGRVRPDVPTLSEYFSLRSFDRDTRELAQDEPSRTDVKKTQGTLNLTWDFTPAARLTSITGYVGSDIHLGADLDATAAPGVVAGDDSPHVDISQFSQELTLTADLTERLDVILGSLYLEQDARNRAIFGAPLIGIPAGALQFNERLKLKSWGLYTQWRFRLSDNLRLSAGVRRITDSKDREDQGLLLGISAPAGDHASWSAWTPRLALDYSPQPNVTLYASAMRGFKAGGFDSLSRPVQRFDPEFVWNYEAGLKGHWLDDRVRGALTVFYMDYEDLQQTILGLEPNAFSARVKNAGSARIRGVEIELDALPTERLSLSFAGAWLSARFGRILSHDSLYPELGVIGPAGLTLRDASENYLVRAPELQLNVSARYTYPLRPNVDAFARASYAWQDKTYFELFNNEGLSQDGYGLIDLFAGIETADERWRVSAFVRNLTDQFYLTGKPIQPTGPVPIGVGHPGLPRAYGVAIEYRFQPDQGMR